MATSPNGQAPTPQSGATLTEARDWLRERLYDGARCPCCEQYARVYRRKLNATMIRALVALYRAGGTERYVHGPTVLRGTNVFGGEVGKLALFGLVAEETARREDGGRSGWWLVTREGEEFLHRRRVVRKYATVYDGRRLGWAGDDVTVDDALGTKFRLDELMRGE